MRVVVLPHRLALLAFACVLAACGAGDGGVPRGTADEPGRAATFRAGDGTELHGRLFGSGTTAIVLAHMFPADARSWYPMAERLAAMGYTALAFNFRGYAPSEGTKDVEEAPADITAAATHLRDAGAKRVALVGASMGGTASLVVASGTPVAAVVTISAPIEFQGLDATDAARKIRAPVLILAAQGDESASDSLRRLSTLIPGATAKFFEGSAHGTNLFADRPGAAEVVTDYLAAHAPA